MKILGDVIVFVGNFERGDNLRIVERGNKIQREETDYFFEVMGQSRDFVARQATRRRTDERIFYSFERKEMTRYKYKP